MSYNPHTILVVDPDERSYKTFESILGVRNRVLFVPNGRTAFDIPQNQHVDIVFISHPLNGTDGIVLLESFKKRFPSIPVVLIVDQPNVNEVISAFRSGARELILKPFDENELVEVTKKYLDSFRKKNQSKGGFILLKRNPIHPQPLVA